MAPNRLEAATIFLYGKAKYEFINKVRLEKFEEAFQIKVDKKGKPRLEKLPKQEYRCLYVFSYLLKMRI